MRNYSLSSGKVRGGLWQKSLKCWSADIFQAYMQLDQKVTYKWTEKVPYRIGVKQLGMS